MTKDELEKIAQVADKKKINAELKRLGYCDCKRHKEYKNIGFDVLFKGDLIETVEYSDANGKQRYQGGIFTNVNNYENLEFIIININDDKNTFPIDMLIWAKEL